MVKRCGFRFFLKRRMAVASREKHRARILISILLLAVTFS